MGTTRRRRTLDSTDRGAVAVEFALVLPILVMLLVGTVTAGVAYSHGLGLTNAVREGSRFGATTVGDGSWGSAVIARTRQTQFDDPSAVSAICAQIVQNSGAATATPSSVVQSSGACSAAGSRPSLPTVEAGACVAVVWASRPFTINIGVASFTNAIKRGAVARYERDC